MILLRPLALILFLGILLIAIAHGLAGWIGGLIGLVAILAMGYIAWFQGDRLLLAAYQAKPVSRSQAPTLHRLVQELSRDAEMPRPRLYKMASPSINAFSTGRDRDRAHLVLSDGLLNGLEDDELAGVIAHELSHIYSQRCHAQTVAAVLAAIIAWPAQALFYRHHRPSGNPLAKLFALLFGLPAALVLHLGISPGRKLAADESAARLTRNPRSLIRALKQLDEQAQIHPLTINPAYQGSLIVIGPAKTLLANLFSTHPDLRDRIERLDILDKEMIRQSNNAIINAMDLP